MWKAGSNGEHVSGCADRMEWSLPVDCQIIRVVKQSAWLEAKAWKLRGSLVTTTGM